MHLLSSEQILLWLFVSIVASVLVTRFNLHYFGVWHVYIRKHILRHLFTGSLMVILSGFVLAFGPSHAWSAILTLIVFGVGSGLILDEIIFLMATNRTDADYTSKPSLTGAIWFTLAGLVALFISYLLLK